MNLDFINYHRMLDEPRYQYCDPAATIISRFGGIDAVAGFTGLNRTTVYKWLREPPQGTGGWIPRPHHKHFVEEANRRGMDFSKSEFIQIGSSESTAA